MVRISTDDGKSINCKEELEYILEHIDGLRPNNVNYTWPISPFIRITQVGGDFTEDKEGELIWSEWERPTVVFVKHITRILEYGRD